MRIAVVTESFLPRTDGVVRTVLAFLEYLHQHGHQALVFAAGPGPTAYDGYPVVRVRGIRFPLYPALTLAPHSTHMRRRMREFRPDLVHLASPFVLGVQGRLAVLRAEGAHREGGREGVGLVAGLAKILAEEPRSPARGLGRHSALEPSRVDQHRRYVEALVADVDLSDVSRSDADLAAAQEVLGQEEQVLSTKRREVQAVMDACSAEVTRRYRDGEADVDALLGVAADEG